MSSSHLTLRIRPCIIWLSISWSQSHKIIFINWNLKGDMQCFCPIFKDKNIRPFNLLGVDWSIFSLWEDQKPSSRLCKSLDPLRCPVSLGLFYHISPHKQTQFMIVYNALFFQTTKMSSWQQALNVTASKSPVLLYFYW